MYESLAGEAYAESDAFSNGIEAQLPVQGSIPRGWEPYEYEDTNEGYELAKLELLSPLVTNEYNVSRGKELYQIYCSVCHGDKGDGIGILAEREKFLGIPAYNEEKNIGAIIIQLKKIASKIIVCDDGSTDSTNSIAKELGAIVISHSKNQGYGATIRSIFLKAKEIDSDILVTIDADGQHDVADVEKIIKPIINNECDIVIGSRFLEKSQDIPTYRKFGINIITKVTNASMKDNLTDSQSGFRAYNKIVLEEISPSETGMGVSTEILIKASNKNLRIGEVPVSYTHLTLPTSDLV